MTSHFLVYKFGKSRGSGIDNITKAHWIIKIKASNLKTYYLEIYDFKEYETKLEDITNWQLGDSNLSSEINYDKIINILFKK